jgi:hypothetical protein
MVVFAAPFSQVSGAPVAVAAAEVNSLSVDQGLPEIEGSALCGLAFPQVAHERQGQSYAF